MTLVQDSPIKPRGVATPTQRRRAVQAEEKRARKAGLRLLVAKTAYATPGTMAEKEAAVYAIADTRLGGWRPTRPTIESYCARYAAGERSLDDYIDDPRVGRTPTAVPAPLVTEVKATLILQPRASVEVVKQKLSVVGRIHSLDVPKRTVLERLMKEARQDIIGEASAQHGRRAGEVDALPHGTLPYTRTLDCLCEDEFVPPVWLGAWSDTAKRFVSLMLWVALVVDYASRCIVGYAVCDPRRRRFDKPRNRLLGFDQHDVMSAFLMSAVHELAPACVAPYSGYLPTHVRFDGSATHFPVKEKLDAAGVDAHIIGGYRPYRNGLSERLGCTVKQLFEGTLGHTQDYTPTDRIKEDPRTTRTKASATSQRVPRRRLIDPEDLNRIEEFESIIVPKVIDTYNRTHVHEALGMTPFDAWHALSRRRDERRSGRAIIRTLETDSVLVTGNSIKVQREGMPPVRFDAVVDGRLLLRGQTLTARIHPLLKALWAVEGDGGTRLTYLRTLTEASAILAASDMAKRHAAAAADASVDAADAQRAVLEREIGPAGIQRAEAGAERALTDDPDPKPQSPQPPQPPAADLSTGEFDVEGLPLAATAPGGPNNGAGDVDDLMALPKFVPEVSSVPNDGLVVINLFDEHEPLRNSLAADGAGAPGNSEQEDTPK